MHYTIYKTTNKINDRIYIGMHETNILSDGYLGSGKILSLAIEKYGIENFTKEILFVFESVEEMISKEIELVDENFVARKDTYNIKKGGKGGAWNKGIPASKESNRKRSATLKASGHCPPSRKGISQSEEHRRNISKSLKDKPKSKDHCRAISVAMKNNIPWNKGKKLGRPTEESNQKRSEAMKGRPQLNISCPHCNKIGGISLMKRWHFNNCKFVVMEGLT